jgi:hypothetical protein
MNAEKAKESRDMVQKLIDNGVMSRKQSKPVLREIELKESAYRTKNIMG